MTGQTVPRQARDLSGIRRGRLLVESYAGTNDCGEAIWNCICDCGERKVCPRDSLTRTKGANSCGCLRREAARSRAKRERPWNEGKTYFIHGTEKAWSSHIHWSTAAIKAFGNKCMRCGWNAARCDVHHKVGDRLTGPHTLSNALVLCPNCRRVEVDLRMSRPTPEAA